MKKFIETLKNCWKIEDLRQRLLIVLLFTAIYRFGSFVVLPGINPGQLEKLQSQTSGGLMSLLDMFSGGAFSNASICAWNHAIHLSFYCHAAPCCRCTLFPEDAA